MKKDLVIACYEEKDGVVTNIGFDVITTKDDGKKEKVSHKKAKADVIVLIKKENYTSIKTSKGTNVHVVKNKYLRTDGDTDTENDLLDCDKCK